jgi:hypothetical protein
MMVEETIAALLSSSDALILALLLILYWAIDISEKDNN